MPCKTSKPTEKKLSVRWPSQQFPDIVKVIAVGNEAMVHWAASYFVAPEVILHWVNHLQGLKAEGDLPSDLWITAPTTLPRGAAEV